MNELVIRIPLPRWRKLIGLRSFDSGKYWSARFTWGQIAGGYTQLDLRLCLFEDHWSFHIQPLWPSIYINLPFLQRWHREPRELMESWGFYFGGDNWGSLVLKWGTRAKFLHMPWDWVHVRWSVYCADGTWRLRSKEYRAPYSDGRLIEVHPYRYTPRSGEVQHRLATIYGDEGEWRWRWLKWLPWPRKIRRGISITFNDEVGEKTGSWKGGCIGCSTEWRRGETMRDALMRMECTRKF